ncbi:hypothetical protein EDD80_1062 [Anseongella ginsenosidimutans]|uniref:Uncharacterized protein n=1 Tax=Anseongella ginsenosidimutans TaxID=496056 RepID=A0A4R3KQS2_9SPHI|nr:hypothetical protein [Anseongella ginsenosidimutans]QEC52155.1 hypothetical protein FRZ59_07265 [Anseongella ginsenosidimutans]TCS86693.1 hypothetical protein EDD80_1062 [Anseongella ginsenosidimutans]
MDLAQIIKRIDEVHKRNRNTEMLLLIGTSLLFACGITCFIMAIVKQEYAWGMPPAITTGLLYYPIKEVKELRKKNIALATAPVLINTLPKSKAAEEISKLLENLFGDSE